MEWHSIFNLVKESLLSFIYPPACIHCGDNLESNNLTLCTACLSLLDVLSHHNRCPRCFSENFNKINNHCRQCKSQTLFLSHQAAVFDYMGPAATLMKRMKYGQ